MYVCICNALNDRQVSGAIRDDGANSVAGVYRALGVRPDCGRCVLTIRDMLKDHGVEIGRPHACAASLRAAGEGLGTEATPCARRAGGATPGWGAAPGWAPEPDPAPTAPAPLATPASLPISRRARRSALAAPA